MLNYHIVITKAIKTRKFMPPKDNLWELLGSIKSLEENSVVAVTSKVVSIGEGRCIAIEKFKNKDELAIKETDKYLPRNTVPHGLVLHTIKNNLFIASAGIDESNGDGFYVLWPKDPQAAAKKIWQFLSQKFKVKNLGIIITDSRLVPLRRGVVGVAIGYFGFKPIRDYRGTKDIFGRKFEMETSNLPDSLATSAVLEMGEGSEQTPLAIITDVSYIEFTKSFYDFSIPEKEDIFYPLFSAVKWKKGGGGI
ncbi:TPA: putative folate metabolism gamma-glutamate ligase [Candidatus Daviesbacteria bacterium]|uniref:Coenzyme F420:L-glutamate ligase-like domain-containing protein n=1 Tax=Candidatus Daviesbacteria bacterium GW2011_GWF2_38_6 TaxID=1618432 RepID=A0A0G0MUL3_9BACT|nr:MAG: hypothetical protein US99_C0041G0004 [Candidatus Daviesbacteria bacterium GW2011_GWF2_38_6]HBQ51275.1 putative folate metabolism gamma-glutamate ligase [Candidatus Daviesbacteria bacterium]HCB22588.1 putative folate metabolism gamma-glutamate ligase [Candidatus Daviesbacteria bacterium]